MNFAQNIDVNTLDAYKSRLDQLLCEVDVPWHLMADALDTCCQGILFSGLRWTGLVVYHCVYIGVL